MGAEKRKREKIAVIFPGVGYHKDKPLLYYGKKLAMEAGCQIMDVLYGGFSGNIKGSREKMEAAFFSARAQTEEILKTIDFGKYENVLFISKSIGTIVAAEYAKSHNIDTEHIYFTPLEDTFRFVREGKGIAFHGTKDPWADTEKVEMLSCRKGIPLFKTEDANHSLETGSVWKDIENLSKIMGICREYLISAGIDEESGK
ncbi:MAG: alpha/beta hydrolase [Ruminococcus sp.]|jgi:hypothetical protein